MTNQELISLIEDADSLIKDMWRMMPPGSGFDVMNARAAATIDTEKWSERARKAIEGNKTATGWHTYHVEAKELIGRSFWFDPRRYLESGKETGHFSKMTGNASNTSESE